MAHFDANYKVKNKKVTEHSSGLMKIKSDAKCEHPLVEGPPLGRKIIETSVYRLRKQIYYQSYPLSYYKSVIWF